MARLKLVDEVMHHDICDASAAVPVSAESSLFLVADDEDKEQTLIRVYDSLQAGPPVQSFELDKEGLQLTGKKDHEIDLEGGTHIGERIFWVGSHSRNKKGEVQPNRHRLFATRLADESLEIEGRPYLGLVEDFEGLELDNGAAPKEGGLSVEGLASVAGELLIGLRSPLFDNKALIIGIKNPDQVVDDEADPRFHDPVLLDLGGRGIRGLEEWPDRECLLILAGGAGDGGDFSLFTWDMKPRSRPKRVDCDFSKLPQGVSPEGIFVHPGTGRIHIVCDEGNREVDRVPCKKARQRSFRTLTLSGL